MKVMGAVVLPACLMVDLVGVDLLEGDHRVVDLVMILGSILEHCNRFLAVLLVINTCALWNFLILIAEDWFTVITPCIRDIAVNSANWWAATMNAADDADAYAQWLVANP